MPRATYRVQLNAGFGFDAAVGIVPYLADLGISHLYVSPILQAVSGSQHGYDVVDHGRISDELGGEAGLRRLARALRAAGMGLVVDVVPNHMAVAGRANRWWWDLLEHGLASPYAGFFDVDWDAPEDRLRNVILLPVLGDHYGRLLEAGQIRLVVEAGRIEVAVGEDRFPVEPRTLAGPLALAAERSGSAELGFIARTLAELPETPGSAPGARERRLEDALVLRERLTELVADPALAAALAAALEAYNADPDRLDRLLDEQHYRLAWWRASSRDLGYRRFFDINTLIGLRVERREVFEATHRVILGLVAEGAIQGLRVDHIDGLRDPAVYLERLRTAAPGAWIVVEKILAEEESLPTGWPVNGTTGYELAALATRQLVDGAGLARLDQRWRTVAPDLADWEIVADRSRREVLHDALGSDLNRLTAMLLGVCEANRRYRDFTRHELHEALPEVVAALDVYRTYGRPDGTLGMTDREVIDRALRRAAARRPDLDAELFELIGSILRMEVPGVLARELALRLQQFTPAVAAKGIEDTALYRYLRLTALNEVGCEPGAGALTTEQLHRAIATLSRDHPDGMRATSTHDTKRSEDVRARIALIAEVADAWGPFVDRLAACSARHWPGPGPLDPQLLELLAQTVVGAWPIDAGRLTGYLRKASREARLATSWIAPDEAWEAGMAALTAGCLEDPAWTEVVEGFLAPLIQPARAGALAQLLLKLTIPGVPDIYQGTELWEHSLVDPDNRRPIDYGTRAGLLAALDAGMDLAEIQDRAEEGLPKLHLVRAALALRRRRPGLFRDGTAYRPLAARGVGGDRLVAFALAGEVACLAPRRPVASAAAGWGDTTVELPDGSWQDLLTGQARPGGTSAVGALLDRFPVALLERTA